MPIMFGSRRLLNNSNFSPFHALQPFQTFSLSSSTMYSFMWCINFFQLKGSLKTFSLYQTTIPRLYSRLHFFKSLWKRTLLPNCLAILTSWYFCISLFYTSFILFSCVLYIVILSSSLSFLSQTFSHFFPIFFISSDIIFLFLTHIPRSLDIVSFD